MPDVDDIYLQPGRFIDSDDPEIVRFARAAVGRSLGNDELGTALRLYYAVRDDIAYEPLYVGESPEYYRASACLAAGRGFCIPKAALLAASARALGLPARVGYADVCNHLTTPRLAELVGGTVYTWHSYTELYLDGRWVKCTPAFDAGICRRMNVHPLAFDGFSDSLFQEFNIDGERHMEYVKERGVFADVPWEQVLEGFREVHPRWLRNRDVAATV
jgi:transglutaminase-like putative cysteine protease